MASANGQPQPTRNDQQKIDKFVELLNGTVNSLFVQLVKSEDSIEEIDRKMDEHIHKRIFKTDASRVLDSRQRVAATLQVIVDYTYRVLCLRRSAPNALQTLILLIDWAFIPKLVDRKWQPDIVQLFDQTVDSFFLIHISNLDDESQLNPTSETNAFRSMLTMINSVYETKTGRMHTKVMKIVQACCHSKYARQSPPGNILAADLSGLISYMLYEPVFVPPKEFITGSRYKFSWSDLRNDLVELKDDEKLQSKLPSRLQRFESRLVIPILTYLLIGLNQDESENLSEVVYRALHAKLPRQISLTASGLENLFNILIRKPDAFMLFLNKILKDIISQKKGWLSILLDGLVSFCVNNVECAKTSPELRKMISIILSRCIIKDTTDAEIKENLSKLLKSFGFTENGEKSNTNQQLEVFFYLIQQVSMTHPECIEWTFLIDIFMKVSNADVDEIIFSALYDAMCNVDRSCTLMFILENLYKTRSLKDAERELVLKISRMSDTISKFENYLLATMQCENNLKKETNVIWNVWEMLTQSDEDKFHEFASFLTLLFAECLKVGQIKERKIELAMDLTKVVEKAIQFSFDTLPTIQCGQAVSGIFVLLESILKDHTDETLQTHIIPRIQTESGLCHLVSSTTFLNDFKIVLDTLKKLKLDENLRKIISIFIDLLTFPDKTKVTEITYISIMNIVTELCEDNEYGTLVCEISMKKLGDFLQMLNSHECYISTSAVRIIASAFHMRPKEREFLLKSYGVSPRTKRINSNQNTLLSTSSQFFLLDETKNTSKFIVSSYFKQENFVEVENLLTNEAQGTLDNRSTTVAGSIRTHLSKNIQDELTSAKVATNDYIPLVMTKTTHENLLTILEAAKNPIPLLLEGATGVGKSATVTEASHLCGTTLVRFNLSSTTTEDDLFGKLNINSSGITMAKQPFTTAFEKGYWILLDEINLAPSQTLQALIASLDTGKITLKDPSQVNSVRAIQRHSDFRLFATQNPNSGFFKGKREDLPSSLLSRFVPVIFRKLPDDEWIDIIVDRLKCLKPLETDESLREMAEKIVKLHITIETLVHSDSSIENIEQRFPEIGPYTEISIRELLRLISHIALLQKSEIWKPFDTNEGKQLLANEMWTVYGARFRREGREIIHNIMKKNGFVCDLFQDQSTTITMNIKDDCIDFDSTHRLHRNPNKQINFESSCIQDAIDIFTLFDFHKLRSHLDMTKLESLTEIAGKVHSFIKQKSFEAKFIEQYGLYNVQQTWLKQWLEAVFSKLANDDSYEKVFATCGIVFYALRFRFKVIQTEFYKQINSSFGTNIDIQTAQKTVGDVSALMSAAPVFVITRRVEQVWKQMVSAFSVNEPILVVGEVGCGKSESVIALMLLIQKRLFSLTFSPETDPSDLVGQFVPVTNNSSKKNLVDWSNGIVTDAIEHDAGLLLDNLSDADACVLERLNSLLEQPPIWVLTEKGDTSPMKIPKNFGIIATMSPASDNASKAAGIGGELSPALSNRFITIFMPSLKPIGPGNENQSKSMNESLNEITLIAERLLGDSFADKDITLAVQLWKDLCTSAYQHQQPQTVSFRTMIRLFDCAYKLRSHTPTLTPKDTFYHAFVATIQEQINTVNKLHEILDETARKTLQIDSYSGTQTKLNLSKFFNENESSSEHVLSDSRLRHAETCAKCVISNYPILFEGPPAVGKTSLIVYLGKKLMGTGMKLERVNNSSTTSVQDYIGSLVPFGSNFEFKPGSLVRAMTNGYWFLADELNLADPSVLSIILTVLDRGEIRIPGTGKFIQAHVQFRFFATQNPASSQFKGRNRLPPILRSRFMEVQIEDFSHNELETILKKRVEEPLIGVPRLISTNELKTNSQMATTMASIYIALQNNPNLRITMREIIKIERRALMFSNNSDNWPDAAKSLLLLKFSKSSIHFNSLAKLLADKCNIELKQMQIDSQPRIEETESGVKFSLGQIQASFSEAKREQSDLFKSDSSPPYSFQRALVQIAVAVKAREPILLIGPTSFKTLLVKTWTQIIGKNDLLQSVHLTAESDANELIGQMCPFSFFATLHELVSLAKAVLARSALTVSIKVKDAKLKEEWKDLERVLSKRIDDFQTKIKHVEDQEVIKNNEQRRQKEKLQTAEDEYKNNNAGTDSNWEDYLDTYGSGTGEFGTTELNNEDNEIFDNYELVDNPYGEFGTSNDHDDYLPNDVEQTLNLESNTFENENTIHDSDQNIGSETIHNQSAIDESYSFEFETHRSAMSESLTNLENDSEYLQDNFEPLDKEELQTLPQELLNAATNLLSSLLDIKDIAIVGTDESLLQSIERIKFIWNTISSPSFNRNKPIFLFRDAAVTRAVKLGQPILIEDFDLANQAATERLNSLLEPNPCFSVTEDITCSNTTIDVLPGFQLFATVHHGSESEPIKISPAARSRFTEIRVEGYSDEEAKSVLSQELKRRLQENEKCFAEGICERLETLQKKLKTAMDISVRHEHSHYDLIKFLRIIDCLSSSTTGLDLNKRLLVAVRFFLLDGVTSGKDIAKSWIETWGLSHEELEQTKKNIDSIFDEPTLDHVSEFIKVTNKAIKSAYCDICMPLRDDDSEEKVFSCLRISSTKTTCKNIARLFTADSARVPLLLEGPPGIGKTAIIDQVCKLRDEKLERINMSANTTVEQLFGSIVAKSDGQQRTFVWQDGAVTRALRKKHSILFDEINLAPPEVLESVVSLLQRDKKTIVLTGNTEPIELNSRIYATMNPANIGGGRSRLPRSIFRMFTSVKLDPYDDIELQLIVTSVFSDLLPENKNSETTKTGDWPILTHEQLNQVFKLHKEIHKLVSSRDIGQTGGPHEINLRDLIKLCDVLRKNAPDLRDHYTFFPKTSSVSGVKLDIRLIIIRKFFRLVYGMRWQDINDRLKVDALINKYLPISDKINNEEDNTSSITIDTSTLGFIRVGSLYVRTGHTEDFDFGKGLVHTPKTVEYLEMLVAALQSKRATMLMGPTASAKSALLYELARICRRQLIVLHLTQETETADLIGQWVPHVCEETNRSLDTYPFMTHIDNFIKRLTKFFLIYVCPVLKQENFDVEREIKNLLPKIVSDWLNIQTKFQLYFNSLNISSDSNLKTEQVENNDNSENQSNFSQENEKEVPLLTEECIKYLKFIEQELSKQIVNLERQKDLCSDANILLLDCKYLIRLVKIHHENQLPQKSHYTEESTTESKKLEMTFKFIESQLVKAIREGHWVVLDNINSAPPEVLERLLSLFEENPVLNLYENNSTEDENNNTEELSGDKIHPGFALFATCNPKLEGANKLSSALTNRVLCISLEALDNDIISDVIIDKNNISKDKIFDPTKTNIFKILLDQFVGVHGGYELLSFCLLCHADAKMMLQNEQIHPIKGFQYSFRTLQYTCSTARYSMNQYQLAPLHAVIWRLLRNYTMCITNLEERTLLINSFKKHLESPFVKKNTFTFVKPISYGSKNQLDLDIDELTDTVSKAEMLICDAMCILMIHFVETEVSADNIADFIRGFVHNVLLQQRPYLKQELGELWKLIDSTGPLSEKAKIEILSDRTRELLCGDITRQSIEILSTQIELCGIKLYTKLYKFIEYVSVFDSEKQAMVLKRICKVFEIFENLFKNIEFSQTHTSPTEQLWYQTQMLIRKINSFNLILSSFRIVNQSSLIQFSDVLQPLFEKVGQRSSGFAIQDILKKPLTTIVVNLENVLSKIKNFHDRFSQSENNETYQFIRQILNRFLIVAGWCAVMWKTTINTLEQQINVRCIDTRKSLLTIQQLQIWDIKLTMCECLPDAIEKLEKASSAIASNDSIRFDECKKSIQSIRNLFQTNYLKNIQRQLMVKTIQKHAQCCEWLQKLIYDSSAGHLISLEYALNENFKIILESIESNEIHSPFSFIWIGLFFTSIAKTIPSRVYVRIINSNSKHVQEINDDEFRSSVLDKNDGLDLTFYIDTDLFESNIAL
ncbi:unnamed protein product, partial [Rotaria sp. Silwood1]